MDFVVAGILIGAILVVTGTVVRDRGPRSRPRIMRDDRTPVAPETLEKAWRRFCVSAGTLITTLGMAIVLVTVVAIVFDASDRAGSIAVAAAVVISAVLLTFATLTMPNHYRRGGFDPVIRTRPVVVLSPAAIEDDLELPLPTGPGQSIDDLFTIGEIAEPSPDVSARVADSQMNVPDIATENESLVDDNRDSAGLVESGGVAEIEPISGSVEIPATIPPPIAPETAARRLTDRLRGTRNPLPQRPTEKFEPAPIAEAAELDPHEDELPAWSSAPAPVRAEPVPPPAPTKPESRPVPRRPGAAGFESSLLVDLDLPDGDTTETGPFQSRLLNELTSDDAPPGEPRADMLLDEFSLPERDQ